MTVKERARISMEALKNDDAAVRRQAACILGIMGPAAGDASQVLKEALRDEDATVRRYASDALGRIGAAAEDAGLACIGAF